VRDFLLRTAVLDQLNGPLCDAVLGEAGAGNARRILDTLEKSNLFLVPLDAQRLWYRYHHLFAEVLQAHLQDEPGIDIAALHRRAGRWYAEQDQLAPAIHHTLAAADFPAAAALLEAVWPEMNQSFRAAGWLQWARQLPDAAVIARPLLGAQYAWALIDVGDMDGAIGRVREVEQQNNVATLEDPIPAMLALARAQIALVHGEFDTAVDYARHGQSLAGDDFLQRAQAAVILGVTNWSRGELEAAYAAMAGWVDSMLAIDNLYFAAASTFVLADLREAQGRLHEAVQIYRRSLARAADQEAVLRPILSHHHLGLAMLYHEMDAAGSATQAWQKGTRSGAAIRSDQLAHSLASRPGAAENFRRGVGSGAGAAG
jgi:LuxR family maltose regulon positive regulatory protein